MTPFDPRLLRLVPRARGPVALVALVGVLTGLATVATAFALAALVVAAVTGQGVGQPLGRLLGLYAVRALLGAAAELASARTGVLVSTALRAALVDRWTTGPMPEPGGAASALTLATSGTAAVEPYAARFLPALVTAAVVPVLAIGTLAVVDWPSALVVVLTVPLLPLFAALIGHTTADATARRWEALSALAGHFLDVVRGLPTLAAYGRAERQVDVVREVSERHRRATLRTLRLAFLSSTALELLTTISVALVAVTVGLRLTTGAMALGPGLVAILLAPEAYWPIRRVGAEFHTAADGSAALTGILDHLERVSEVGRPSREALGPVRLRDVSYTHPGATTPTLTGVTLDLGPGLTVVTGPSGVGKSTLLEVLAGLRTPTTGTVVAPAAHLVGQRPFLMAGTVRANLTLADAATDEQLWAALRTVRLDGAVAALPGALDGVLGDDGFGLSAGQRQRLVLARALLAPPGLLLLDEPTAHLDPRGADELAVVIAEAARCRPVVAVTHRPELVDVAGRHVVLDAATAGAPR